MKKEDPKQDNYLRSYRGNSKYMAIDIPLQEFDILFAAYGGYMSRWSQKLGNIITGVGTTLGAIDEGIAVGRNSIRSGYNGWETISFVSSAIAVRSARNYLVHGAFEIGQTDLANISGILGAEGLRVGTRIYSNKEQLTEIVNKK